MSDYDRGTKKIVLAPDETWVPANNTDVGLKYDGNKPDLSLLPPEFLSEVAKAFMYGEAKYGRYNFTGGMQWCRLGAAALRHLTAWAWGEDNDKESGISHLGHAGACIAMLCMFVNRGIGTDNRYKGK